MVSILPKSMPPVPEIFAMNPLVSSVVALPRIFGPMTMSVTETIENRKAMMMLIR